MKKATILSALTIMSFVSLSQQKFEGIKSAAPGTYQFIFTDENSDPVNVNGSTLRWIEENREENRTVFLKLREGTYVKVPPSQRIKQSDFEWLTEYIVDPGFKPILIQRE